MTEETVRYNTGQGKPPARLYVVMSQSLDLILAVSHDPDIFLQYQNCRCLEYTLEDENAHENKIR